MASKAAKRASSAPLSDQVQRGGLRLPPALRRQLINLGLVLLGTLLLTLSFAPFGQFYLAYVGLVPVLLVVGTCRRTREALAWSYFAGVLYFSANLGWLSEITVPGTIGIVAVLGLYWVAAAWAIRGGGFLNHTPPTARWAKLRPFASATAVAVLWVGLCEWLRSSWPFGGIGWVCTGYSQTPMLPLCQIADLTGVLGVSFLVVIVNAILALLYLHRANPRPLWPAGAVIVMLLIADAAYGVVRLSEKTTYAGPAVLVVQSNFRQKNSGEKGASPRQMFAFHYDTTRARLADPSTPVDLVAWSETMMPPLNADAVDTLGRFYTRIEADLAAKGKQLKEQPLRPATAQMMIGQLGLI